MNGHATMNRIYRLVWSDRLQAWVAVAEIARGHGKRSGVSGAVPAEDGPSEAQSAWRAVLGAALLSFGVSAFAAPPVNQLPTGGKVAAGAASISQTGARMDVNQSSSRAVIDWSTFNVGAAAQVNFNQPSASAATLNRVMDTQASQILGRVTANGQVFLVNPNGVYFGKGSSVDVGGLVASTKGISNEDFMAGRMKFSRNDSTGSVVNEGDLRAALGGYIALLAPEVRNEGVIVAQLGTVAMASGESVTLQFEGGSLAGIIVEPSKIRALVENKGAVMAPGGVIILSAKALDRLQGGVVKNSGKLEATGMSMRGGKIVLEASDRIENSGQISANAGADDSPAGQVSLSAPEVTNTGAIEARDGGRVAVEAAKFVQTATGRVDVGGAAQGGAVRIDGATEIVLGGELNASAEAGSGGSIDLASAGNVTINNAVLDASGATRGGRITVEGGREHDPLAPARTPPTTAILGNSVLRASSRRGVGGRVSLTGERVGLFDDTVIDASGASAGGQVWVGGGYQGRNAEIANAQATYVGEGVAIHADGGMGGEVVVWADGVTRYLGHINARGVAQGGAVEVSGKGVLDFRGTVDLSASAGRAGTLLLDPYNLTISSGTDASTTGTFDASGTGSVLNITTLQNALANGDVIVTTGSSGSEAGNITVATTFGWFASNSLTLSAANNITVNTGISMIAAGGGSITLAAGGSIANAGSVQAFSGNLTATASGGTISGAGSFVAGGNASFTATGDITANSASNKLSGTVALSTSSPTGAVSLVNSVGTALKGATAGSGGVSIISTGSITTAPSPTGITTAGGALSLTTSGGSNGSILITDTVTTSGGTISLQADGTGAVSVPKLTGAVTISGVTAGGAITLGDTNTGAVTLDSVSGNVISGTAGSGGQASGIVTINGASITINDPIRTKGGNIVLNARTGAVTAIAGVNITTTADADTGTSSGTFTVNAATGMTLQNITTTGATNSTGVGSNAAGVTLTLSTGDISVGAITTSGGDATSGATTNRNGGNAGNIVLGASAGNIFLNGDLKALGGSFVGAATQGLGGYIEVQTPVVLKTNVLASSGATSGNVFFLGSIDSDATPRSLTVLAGTGDVMFDGVIGGTAPLSTLTVSSSVRTDIEKSVTTNAAGGINVTATAQIRLGDDDVSNGAGAATINTLAGNGVVSLSTPIIYLDDAITFTRGSGTLAFTASLESKASERNDLTFNGSGGGTISMSGALGAGASSSAKLGNVLLESVTNFNFDGGVFGKSLRAVNTTGRITIGGSQNYDGALGLQLKTVGTANTFSGDENLAITSSVTLTDATAPITISSPNGALTLGGGVDLVSANGTITLSGIGVSQTSSGSTSAVINAGSGKIRIDGGGGTVTIYTTLITTNADTAENGAASPAILVTNTNKLGGTNAVTLRNVTAQSGTLQIGLVASEAAVASTQAVGGAGALSLAANTNFYASRRVTLKSAGNDTAVSFTVTGTNAAGATISETLSGGNATTVTTTQYFKTVSSITANAATASTVSAGLALEAVVGSVGQDQWVTSDRFDINTLSIAASNAISLTSTSNIIDQLGNFSVGSSLDVRAKGRTAGMALTGDVSATAVTIKTGNGALVIGDRNITATAGDMLLQGRGITQSSASLISASGLITMYGSVLCQRRHARQCDSGRLDHLSQHQQQRGDDCRHQHAHHPQHHHRHAGFARRLASGHA